MNIINVELGSQSYPVYLGRDLLGNADLWRRHLAPGKTLVVTNDVVAPLYLDTLRAGLQGVDFATHVIPDGEPHKTVETWRGVLDTLIGMEARRDANIIALGGGVVGDISGFAAASYMRGIRFIQAPTTLLSQVDASVGGKTGVNHEEGKNLIGAFHQPAAVLIDSRTLGTLESREFTAGLAEVVKYGAIRDPEFFEWLEQNADAIIDQEPAALEHLIDRSVRNKAEIVAEDELEVGVRALLNFGHSFGHALEAETAYSVFLHGEAVSIGMVTACRLSEMRGLCESGATERLSALLRRFRLPVEIPVDTGVERMNRALQLDKKAVATGLRLILLKAIGEAVVDSDSRHEQIVAAIETSLGGGKTIHLAIDKE